MVVYVVFYGRVLRFILLLDSIMFICCLVKCFGVFRMVVRVIVDDGFIICLSICQISCIVVMVLVLCIVSIDVVGCSSVKLGWFRVLCRLLQMVFGVMFMWCLSVVSECVVLVVFLGLVSISCVVGVSVCMVSMVFVVRLLLFIGIIRVLNGLWLCSSFSVVVFCLVIMWLWVQGCISVLFVLVCICVYIVLWVVMEVLQCYRVVLWWMMLVSLVVIVFLGIIIWQVILCVWVVSVSVVLWLFDEWVIMLCVVCVLFIVQIVLQVLWNLKVFLCCRCLFLNVSLVLFIVFSVCDCSIGVIWVCGVMCVVVVSMLLIQGKGELFMM